MNDRAILLRPARVWTAEFDSPRSDLAVLVQDGRIVAVDSAEKRAAPDARSIDLPGMTLIPGLMDLHSHLFLYPYDETPWDAQVLKESEAYRTARAVKHARQTLEAGFTLLRDLGTEGADPEHGLRRWRASAPHPHSPRLRCRDRA